MLNIDDRLIKDFGPKIKPNALSVLLAIAIHMGRDGKKSFPSHKRLMSLTGLGRDAVYVALNVLKKYELIEAGQPIDSKSGKFGQRTFSITTEFVRFFNTNPLPENPEVLTPLPEKPYTAEPYTVNQETKVINKEELLKDIYTSPIEKNEGNGAFARIDPEAEVERMRADYAIREAFTKSRRIPSQKFELYLSDFLIEVKGAKSAHYGISQFRNHFLNWSDLHWQKEQKGRNSGPKTSHKSSINRAGGDQSKYEEQQNF